jgi:hypothetical protein
MDHTITICTLVAGEHGSHFNARKTNVKSMDSIYLCDARGREGRISLFNKDMGMQQPS